MWIDPEKLVGYNLTADDVTKAIEAQNAQVASGSVGAEPSNPRQPVSALVLVKGQLNSPDDFGSIVLRANADGSTVRLRDVARIEIGGMGYQFTTRLNGKPSAGLSVLLSPSGNALATAKAVKAKMDELARFFPPNIRYDIPYNITPVIDASIAKVLPPWSEAVVLVFLVMFLFLQNLRDTLIPTIVVPVALLGTFMILLVLGFSINVLTMFAMVLAIGIAGRRCHRGGRERRAHHERGRAARRARRRARRWARSPARSWASRWCCRGVHPDGVLSAARSGVIYRQFSVTMVSAMLFSALLALSLTPALCATLLKPVAAGHHTRQGLFRLVQSRDGPDQGRLQRGDPMDAAAHRPDHAHLCGAGHRDGLVLRAAPRRLSAGR